MKLTKSKLKQIIKEELRKVLQEKLTPQQRAERRRKQKEKFDRWQADHDVAASYDLAGPLAPGGPGSNPTLYGIGRNLGDVGFAGREIADDAAPEVFKRKSEETARYLECHELTARRLKKLGFQWPKKGDTLAGGETASYDDHDRLDWLKPRDYIDAACGNDSAWGPCPAGFIHKISDDATFLECFKYHVAITVNPQ